MKCVHPSLISNGKRSYYVPCGRCAWCRRRKQDDWFFRLGFEARFWPFVSFVTLTYDDDNIPNMSSDQDGVLRYYRGFDFVRPSDVEVKSFCYVPDVQKYFKRLTKRLNLIKVHQQFYMKPTGQFYLKPSAPGRKYICVSEYGSKSGRPHYHFILFASCDIDCSLDWPFGQVVQGPADLGSFRYVTKYLLKGSSSDNGRVLCSRGIGEKYLSNDYIDGKLDRGADFYLPRYLREKWFKLVDDAFLDHDIKLGLVPNDSVHCLTVKNMKDSLLDDLYFKSPYNDLEKDYLLTHSNLDGFDQWLSDIYNVDLRKQYKINSHGKV